MRRNQVLKKIITALMCGTLVAGILGLPASVFAASSDSTATAASTAGTVDGKITVDGNLDDWAKVPEQKSTDAAVSWWKIAKDSDGNLYVCFTGAAVSEWYGDYQWKYFGIKKNSDTWQDSGFQFANLVNTTGGSFKVVNTANGNTAGSYYCEAMIPVSYLADPNGYTITFVGTTLSSDTIQILSGKDAATPKEEPKYNGITIDGSFSDWDAVKKYDANDPNKTIEQGSMVFDGDYVYLYLKDAPGMSAAGAGSHSNGRFAITTDLGKIYPLTFQQNGTVMTPNGTLQGKHVGSEWEVAVPKKDLPEYQKTLNFGLYQADANDPDPFITGISNLDGTEGKSADIDPNKFQFNGDYSEWENYPHTLIEYATAGSQDKNADGMGALYYKDNKVYGHVYSAMNAHLNEKGGEFTSAVTIRINREKEFYPRFVTIDSTGNVNWNPTLQGLSDGTYRFVMVDSQGWSNAATRTELNDGKHGNAIYGEMYVTIKNGKRDECEFYVEDEKLAAKFNMEANAIQYVDAQFGRIGQQWFGTAGSSTNPFLGVAICIGAVGTVYIFQKRKKKKVLVPVTA